MAVSIFFFVVHTMKCRLIIWPYAILYRNKLFDPCGICYFVAGANLISWNMWTAYGNIESNRFLFVSDVIKFDKKTWLLFILIVLSTWAQHNYVNVMKPHTFYVPRGFYRVVIWQWWLSASVEFYFFIFAILFLDLRLNVSVNYMADPINFNANKS